MTQKILKVGTSSAVTIPKDSMKELGLKPGDTVRVEVDREQRTVTITPDIKLNSADERVAKLTYRFIERYRKDLEALADE